MTVDTETVFVDTIDIVVFAHIDAVAVMIGIAAPYEVVIPQMIAILEIIGKEGKGTEDGRGERIAVGHQLFGHDGP